MYWKRGGYTELRLTARYCMEAEKITRLLKNLPKGSREAYTFRNLRDGPVLAKTPKKGAICR
jgi:hypothetical protein